MAETTGDAPSDEQRLAAFLSDKPRHVAAFDLRTGGATFATIGKLLECSEATAWRLVKQRERELTALEAGDGEARDVTVDVAVDLQRLEDAARGLMEHVRKGDPQSVRALVAIVDKKQELLGLKQRGVGGEITGRHLDALLAALLVLLRRYVDPEQFEPAVIELGKLVDGQLARAS